MNFNKVILIGNLTRDAELKVTPSGKSVLNFGLATNKTWVDANGQKQQQTEFHNLVMWGKKAEVFSQYLTKGKLVLVEGYLRTRTWLDQDNKKRSQTEIVAENIQFGPNIGFKNENFPAKKTVGPLQESIPTINEDNEDEINGEAEVEDELGFGDEADEIPF